MPSVPQQAREEVLSTLNKDGSRRLIRPRLSPGRFLRWRRVVGWSLISIFFFMPFCRLLLGFDLFHLDIARRTFVVFGGVFLATDSVPLLLFAVSITIAVFLVTALFGRIWCGWACPQTVYMELVYRPIERLFEGSAISQRKLDRSGGTWRRSAKHIVFVAVSIIIAHTFIAYFVPVELLIGWVFGSPSDHPYAFTAASVVTLLVLADFAWFREQMCILACPYGRLQSVLIDKMSLIIGYDRTRGEPRAKRTKKRPKDAGDCVDCGLCNRTCPTGIDIRRGLQMECIGCAQCIDACDAIMERTKKPRGLIRYASQQELAGSKRRALGLRIVIYPLLLIGFLALLGMALANRSQFDVILLRGKGLPFAIIDANRVSNQIRIKVTNRGEKRGEFMLAVVRPKSGIEVITPTNPLIVDPGATREGIMFVLAHRDSFDFDGGLAIEVEISNGKTAKGIPFRLMGPLSRRPMSSNR